MKIKFTYALDAFEIDMNQIREIVKTAKAFLASAPSDYYGIGYQENRQALSRAIAEFVEPN